MKNTEEILKSIEAMISSRLNELKMQSVGMDEAAKYYLMGGISTLENLRDSIKEI